ncbi:MAG: tyrosine-type recombinase/integrase [Proteobacteria bacterium]|nr:tyrosine-type recombinase/integrase [Pseudomonadota bacterium]
MFMKLITDFLEYCKVSCYSSKSMAALRTRTKEFIRFLTLIDIQSVQELTYVNLLEYVADFEEPTVHVKKNRVWFIRKFYAFLILHDIVKENIGINLPSPKIKKTVPKFLTIDDCDQLFEYFSKKAIDLTGLRNLIIFLIFCVTGVRINALRSMNVTDFDDLSGLLFINEKGGVRRQMVLPEVLCLLLKEYLLFQNRKSGPLFLSKRGKRIAERTLQMIFRDALVDLEISKYFHVHLFRHTAGTMLAKVAGLSITKHILGHNVMSNTETYVHLNPDIYGVHMANHPYMKYVKGGAR